MRTGIFVPLLSWLLPLAACTAPPKPPTVDESRKRPVNAQAAIELQICTHELHNTQLLQAQTDRREQFNAVMLANMSARHQFLAAAQASSRRELANRLFTVHFDFGDARVSVPDEIGSALVAAAKEAPLVLLRGRTDGNVDSVAEARMAQTRAAAVRDYLVAGGVDPARIRTTHQPVGDNIADNVSHAGRRLNRRVEIELYSVAPVAFEPAATARR